MITIYGIKNCNKVATALSWLEGKGLAYEFHDYKKKGIDAARLQAWIKQGGLPSLINRKGTTWKKLTPEEQALLESPATAIPILQQHTSVIVRPILEWNNVHLRGFQVEAWSAQLPV